MILIVIIIAAAIVSVGFYLLFILLFLIRRLGSRRLWSKTLRFMWPVMRELYAGELADGANRAIQAMPDEIRLEHQLSHTWQNPESANSLSRSLRHMGFSDAGIFSVDKLPGVFIRLMFNERESAGAAVYEHPEAGVWAEIYSDYSSGNSVDFTMLKDPGLPKHMQPPYCRLAHLPGISVEALHKEFLSAREPGEFIPLTSANIKERFEDAWAKDMDWRKQMEMYPDEALAFKKGKPMPDENRKGKKWFDIACGAITILNLAGMLTLLFMARNYVTIGCGPLRSALWHALIPLLIFLWFFINSIRTSGPISRLTVWIVMGIITYPFFLGTVYLGEVWLNGAKDIYPPSVHSALVVGKKQAKGRHDRSWSIRLKSWNPGRETEQLGVTEAQYSRVQPGKTVARVTTKPGFLGYEWIAGLSFEP